MLKGASRRLRIPNARCAQSLIARNMSSSSSSSPPDALVYLVQPAPTGSGADQSSSEAQRLWSSARTASSSKALDTRLIFGENSVKSLVSLGDAAAWARKSDSARREVVRKAAGTGVAKVRDIAASADVKSMQIDGTGKGGDAHAAAVGAHLGLHNFTLKTGKDVNPGKEITLSPAPGTDADSWARGVVFAEAQILARELMELPANMMTPTIFCERIKKEAEGLNNVEVIVRDEAWAEEKGMRTFLSVTKGTSEPAKLLEFHYKGASASSQGQPLAFVGKGITFDSGGISLKPGANMKLMRGDMGGAATVCAAALAIARLRIPIDLVTVVPLCENMPGPSANKPGDIIHTMNGKTVEIDNTDAEGRLILADALYYASTTFNAHTVVDVATLTGAMETALGNVFSGVFSTSDSLWSELHAAGEHEHDRFWRMPLDDAFAPQISGSNADLCNTGGRPGGACTAALFLKSFVDGIEDSQEGGPARVRWAHVDIAGSMEAVRPEPYQYKGMTGRPTRALIEFATRLAQQ
ncbi:leucine aminopeptidase [Phellopilus nigrolimitatus]|nr:leucine aminopeptidase [Phellopilus nigrolimitatus]